MNGAKMNLASAVSPNVLQALGWALAHFLWQGAVIAALAAALMTVCERPTLRYAIGILGLVAMLAAPVVTFLVVKDDAGSEGLSMAAATGVAMPGPLPGVARLNLLPWLVEAWLCGVLFFSLRFAGGVLLLERKCRGAFASPDADVLALCRRLQQQLGLDRSIRYLQCDWLQAPAVIGWLRPAVLLPVTALTGFSEAQLRAVIAHELAHIRRHDAFVNLFQILAETLLFYHPAVWWLNRRIRAEREICCDEVAISISGDRIAYARALTLMEEWKRAPALAMAANHGLLSERIFCVLGRETGDARPRLMGWNGVLLLTALALGMALLRMPAPVPVPRPQVMAQAIVPPAVLPQSQAAPVNAVSAKIIPHSAKARNRKPLARARMKVPAQSSSESVAPPPANVVDATAATPIIALDIAPARLIVVNDPPGMANPPAADPVLCRPPQQLPGSRLFGPKICRTQSEWAGLRIRNEDVSPDGRQVVQTLVADSGSILDIRIWQGVKPH
jgi:beta-lactamase regulating signal transducer with metallopeptidase domain